MGEDTAQRIGSALRRMAEDLVAERKRSAALERENRILRARLEALGDEQTAKSADSSGD